LGRRPLALSQVFFVHAPNDTRTVRP
jgi:hypothetical protein